MTRTNFVMMLMLFAIMISVTVTSAYADIPDSFSLKSLQSQLETLTETLFEQKCVPGMAVTGIDSNGHVICEDKSIDPDSVSIIPFTTADMGYGTDTKYVGAGNSLIRGINPIVMPADGTITNLVSRSNLAPDMDESFIITLLKNGQETQLSCIISSDEKTCNDSDKVDVVAGDAIEAKITSTVSTDPESLYVNTSVLFAKSH